MWPWTTVLTALVLILVVESSEAGESGDHHPCRRPCVAGQVYTCQYNFTLEWYRTLSKACYDCPFNTTDCYREECIAADGKIRMVIAINRQVPGPAIEVCDGDTVEVRVTNMLEDGLSTSIHWHGQHVLMEPYFDGVGQITQCNIQYMETFVYKFHTGPAGTHWYHAHTGMQLADGAFGAFIVRQAAHHDPNDNLYTKDLSQHTFMLYNWTPEQAMAFYFNLMYVYDVTFPQSVMVNGRARVYDVANYLGLVDTNLTHARTPLEVVHVQSGETYRLRFISAAPACPFQVSVDGHQLMVISVDGMPLVPRVLDAFIIHPGERYDFVLTTNQTVSNYWMRVIGLGDCEAPHANGMAIVRYEGAPDQDPSGDPSVQRDGILMNPILDDLNVTARGHNRPVILTDEMQDFSKTNYTDEVVHFKYTIGMDYNNNDNTKFNNKRLYPVKDLKPRMFHATPVMDNITFVMPYVPLLSEREDVDPSWFCNRSTLLDPDYCLDQDLCMCTHRVRVPLNKVVELTVLYQGRFFADVGHIMHLHGHNFRLMGLGKVGPSLSRSDLEELEARGELRRNYIQPPVRDTVNVPDGGYAILRFTANNPGYWFFHCHTDSHLQQGMALLIQVGEEEDLPPLPDQFPRCGGMGFSNAKRNVKTNPCPTGSASTLSAMGSHALVIMLIFIYSLV